MSWQKPQNPVLWQAIEIYLKHAYPEAQPPLAVRGRIDALRGENDPLSSNLWERDSSPSPKRYSLRLGNVVYPHMKLVVECAPDGQGYLLRADTHDKHVVLPPTSKEHAAFAELMKHNHEVSNAIEETWVDTGLPTFKDYLRKDLAKRARR